MQRTPPSVFIYADLDSGQKLWNALDLVQKKRFRIGLEKRPRVVAGQTPNVRIFAGTKGKCYF